MARPDIPLRHDAKLMRVIILIIVAIYSQCLIAAPKLSDIA